ncbi:putative MAX gene-associated protein isoform X7 [Apostichopus japonicus]|uniref:Putative MAX gene-associated protein isoform X7 n=1 Tax=Stichopus japonicus TaxID=307972 RepID=A0A2G8LHZ6_STIJA|nr:putative MAX gene-associated protein isoform X7 [Apostichopus japonicus]
MPIIVSVASVESGDTFKTPGEVSDKESPGSLEKEGFESKRSAEESEISSPNIVQCQGSVTTDVLVGSSAAAVGYDEDNIGQNPSMGTASESNGNFGGSETIAAEEREVDVIDGISFLSFASKEDLIRYTATSNRKGKGKRKSTSVLGITWAMSKRKRKLLKKSPKPQKLSIFPGNLKEQSQKQIEDYQNTFLQDLKQQKRQEILHPALLKKRCKYIKRSLDCGIPLVLDLELLGVNLDKEDGPPKKKKKKKKRKKSHKSHDTVYEVLSSVVKEASPKPSLNTDDDDDKEISYFDDIDDFDQETLDTYTTENSDDETGNDLRQDIFDQSNRLADASGTDLQKRTDQSTRIEEPLQTQSLSTIVEETSKKDGPVSGILTNENEVFKPFEKPVISHTAAFQSSELDLYLDKEVKEKTGTPGTRDKEKKKSLSSRHMKRLNSAIQGISLSSLFTGKRPSDKIPSFSKKVADPNKLNVRKEVAGIDTISEQRAMVTSGGSKTRIGNTILRKSTAGAARFHRDLKVRAAVDKKDHLVRKGEIPQPKASNSDLNWQSDRSSKQSTFLDRLVHNVRQATGSEMKPSSKPKSVKSSSMKDQDSTAKIDRLVHNVSQATGTEMEASSKPKLVKSALLKDQDSTAKIDRLVHNVRQATGTEMEASSKPKLVKSALLKDQDSTAKIDRLVHNVRQATGTEKEASIKPKLVKSALLTDQDSTAKIDRLVQNVSQATGTEMETSSKPKLAKPSSLKDQDSTAKKLIVEAQKVDRSDYTSLKIVQNRIIHVSTMENMRVASSGFLPVRDPTSPSIKKQLTKVVEKKDDEPSSRPPVRKSKRKQSFKVPCIPEEGPPMLRDYDALPGMPAKCGSDFCRLGCICDSLSWKAEEDLQHCRKLECMFECSCERFPSLRILRARKRPAIFRADGMVFYDETGLMSDHDNGKKKRLDPSRSKEKSCDSQRKSCCKSASKPVRTTAFSKVIEKKKEVPIKETKNVITKQLKKDPGFSRGRVYIAKHIRYAARMEEQKQEDLKRAKSAAEQGSSSSSVSHGEGRLPPLKVVRTSAGFAVKTTVPDEETQDGFRLLKRVDRMMLNNQQYRRRKAEVLASEQAEEEDNVEKMNMAKRNETEATKASNGEDEQGDKSDTNATVQSEKGRNQDDGKNTIEELVWKSRRKDAEQGKHMTSNVSIKKHSNAVKPPSTKDPAVQTSIVAQPSKPFDKVAQSTELVTHNMTNLQSTPVPAKQLLLSLPGVAQHTFTPILQQGSVKTGINPPIILQPNLIPILPKSNVTPIQTVSKMLVQKRKNKKPNTEILYYWEIASHRSAGRRSASDGSKAKNIQAFLVHNPDGKAVLLVPTQTPDKNPELAIPGVSGAVPRAENRKATSVKESLSALRQPQRVKRLCDIAGHATSLVHLKQKHPFKNLRSVFVPNNHPCNTNRAFHLLVDVFSNCSWEQDAANLNQPIFNLAAKAGTVPHLKIAKYTVQRIGFKKHSQAARCINVSSSVAGNCREKIRIIGLFESKFFITDGREPLLQITELAPIPCQSKATKVDAPNEGEPIGTGEKSQQSGVEIHGSERKYETELKSEADVGKEKAIEGRIKDLTANVEVVHTIDDSSEEGNSNSLESVGSQLQPGKGSQPQDDISTGENLKLQPALVSRDSESAVCRRDQTFSEKDLVKLSSQPLGESADDRSISGPDKIEIGNNESAQGMKSFRAVESFPATNVSLEKRDTSANKSKEQHDRHSCHDEQVATTTTSRQKEDCKVVRKMMQEALLPNNLLTVHA